MRERPQPGTGQPRGRVGGKDPKNEERKKEKA